MGAWYRTQRTILAGALIVAGAAVLFTTPVALARHPYLVWVDGLMQRIEPKYREVAIWDYQGGRST